MRFILLGREELHATTWALDPRDFAMKEGGSLDDLIGAKTHSHGPRLAAMNKSLELLPSFSMERGTL